MTLVNTSGEDVSEVGGTSPGGALQCGDTELAPGESTTCTGTFVPGEGDQAQPIQVSGVTASGSPMTSSSTIYVRGTRAPAASQAGPAGQAPAGQAPTAEAPTAEAPTAEAPTAEAPTVEVPTQVNAGASGAASGSMGVVPGPGALAGPSAVTGPILPQQGVDPVQGAYPMPVGPVAAGAGGTVTSQPEGRSDYTFDPLHLLALFAGAGAAVAAGARVQPNRRKG